MSQVIALVSAVRVGAVRTHLWDGREYASGALKEPVPGPVWLGKLGFAGDEQADRVHHGGSDKAVLCYAAQHYARWAEEQGLSLPVGGFFENVTLTGPDGSDAPDERSVLLGETWRLGGALVQVSQPRSPCYKLARRWRVPDLVARVQQTGWSGWYLRVLEPGRVSAGDPVVLVGRPAGAPSVGAVARILNVDKNDLAGARWLLGVPDLPERWRQKLLDRLAGREADDSARLAGPDRMS